MITVTITKTLDSLWATPEALAAMTDEEIVCLCREDLIEFAACAEWVVRRSGTTGMMDLPIVKGVRRG